MTTTHKFPPLVVEEGGDVADVGRDGRVPQHVPLHFICQTIMYIILFKKPGNIFDPENPKFLMNSKLLPPLLKNPAY